MSEPQLVKPIRIRVLDREYTLRVREGDEAATRAMADYVDARMQRFRTEHPEQSEFTSAIITALALAEEVFGIREDYDDMQTTLNNIRKERLQIREDYQAMQEDCDLMNAYQAELEADVKRLQHEHAEFGEVHAALEREHERLHEAYAALQHKYQHLNDTHTALQQQHLDLSDDLGALADTLDRALADASTTNHPAKMDGELIDLN